MKKFLGLLLGAFLSVSVAEAAPLYVYQPITSSGGGGGTGTVTSVSNSDGTLTLSPNPITGAGSVSLNLGNANTWTSTQTFPSPVLNGTVSGTAVSASSSTSTLVLRDSNQNAFSNSFTSLGQTVATAAGTTTLTVASPRFLVLTGSTTQTVVMPDATTLTPNESSYFTINNNSSGVVTINANGGGLLYTAQPGSYVKVNLLTNATAVGTWDVHPSAPSIATWGTGGAFAGLQLNNALSTTPEISSGASSSTAPAFIPQRGAATTGLGGSSTTLSLISGGTDIADFVTTGITFNKNLSLGANTLNKVTITAPATGSTLTIADGKTLTDTSGVGASILLGAVSGGFTGYAGTTCTNQVLTALSSSGGGTCNNVSNAYLIGQIGLSHGGTNADLSSTGGTGQVLKQITAGGNITVGQLSANDLSNGISGSGAVVLVSSPTITTPGIVGVTNASNATAGNIGEYVSSTVTAGSGIAITTATPTDVTTLSLSAGDWDVSGNVWLSPAGTTSVTLFAGWVNTTSATQPSSTDNSGSSQIAMAAQTGGQIGLSTGERRINISSTTTVYLSCLGTFTVSTAKCFGTIRARRVR